MTYFTLVIERIIVQVSRQFHIIQLHGRERSDMIEHSTVCVTTVDDVQEVKRSRDELKVSLTDTNNRR